MIAVLSSLSLMVLAKPVHAQEVTGDLLARINNLRADLGLSPYSINNSLAVAANNHAQWMVDTGQVSHSQADGSTPRDRARAAGYTSTWVSENIYMGWDAGSGAAWSFWVNSPVHYAGLTSPNYQEIGVGSAASGQTRSFVLVFGNPSSGSNVAVSLASNSRAGNTENAASIPGLPPYVVGVDTVGNIMHEVQPGDTLGDIALIYGYTWGEIPYMLEINGLTQDNIRELQIGSIFLVPPFDGTYTPTPSIPSATPTSVATTTLSPTPSPTPAFTATALALPLPVTYVAPTITSQIIVRPLGGQIPDVTASPTRTPENTSLAMNSTAQDIPMTANETTSVQMPSTTANAMPDWLLPAILLQLIVLGIAIGLLVLRRLPR